MKYLYTLASFFTFLSLGAQELTYNFIAEYELKYQADLSNPKDVFLSEPFILYVGSEKSFYISTNKIARDTLIHSENVSTSDLPRLMSMPKPSTSQRFIKIPKTSTLVVYDEISSSKYTYSECLQMNWNIESDTIRMANQVLKKATTHYKGRDYIAWYNENIPISDGPYKFNGLPGLIFKVYDSEKQFSFEILNYKTLPKEKVVSVVYENKPIETTGKKFKESKYKFYKDPFPMLESEGFYYPAESKNRIREKYRQFHENSYDNKIEFD